MKLRRLWIDRCKNLRNCDVTSEQPYLLNAMIGGNGSGKSNLVEAILHISPHHPRHLPQQSTAV